MKTICIQFIVFSLYFFSQAASAQFVEQQQIIGSGGIGGQLQGSAVAISKDGRTAVVGAYADSVGRGAIYVFTRLGATWVQQGSKLSPNNAVYTNNGVFFGYSVAISADGNTIIAGGPNDNTDRGAAWIFTRTGNTWTQGPKLVGSGTSNIYSKIGSSVNISDDGNTALLGGWMENGLQGAAWVFTRIGNNWTQQGPKITPPTNTWTEFGEHVSLSSDGNTALIAGEKYMNKGAAFVFRRIGNVWSRDTTLQDLSNTYTIQGAFVNISKDGNTAFVASNAPGSPQVGSIAIYVYNGTAWTFQTRFSPPNNIGSSFAGRAMASSHSGDTLAIGGYQDNSNKGAVWMYVRSSTGTWSMIGSKLVPTGTTSTTPKFGSTVALSGNGKLLLVGAPEETSTGKVWFYSDTNFNLISPSVSISSSASSICSGTSVTFTATPTDGGPSPTYQWKKNGSNVGTNSATYSDNALAHNDVIQVQMVSNMTGASPTPVNSQNITMSVTPTVVPTVSIASNAGTVINPGQSVTFTATATNTGASPTYRWLLNGAAIVGATATTYTTSTLAHNDVVSVLLLSNAPCANPDSLESNKITMSVITGVSKANPEFAVTLHPNPVQKELIISTEALTAPLTVTLTDATGRVYSQQVFVSGTTQFLDLSNVASGLYLVSVQSKNEVQHFRVVKQ